MTRSVILAIVLSLVAIAAAAAQGIPIPPQQAQVYDQSTSFGLSNAGVQPGPYVKAGGGYSFPATQFHDTPVFGGGVGFRFTPWLRTDATFDYRSNSNDVLAGNARFTNWAAMLNGYIDLNFPFIRPLIPYVGAGVGVDQNKVGTSIVTVSGTTVASLTGSSKNQFAWQAMAGLSWYITPTLALDVGYRYFSGGEAESGVGSGFPVHSNFNSHEVVAALRLGF